MDTIKCGRKTYELTDGDTILDNGATLQLITRKVRSGWDYYSPRVSKKAFKEFKNNPNVEIETNHNYGNSITLYVYRIEVAESVEE